MVNLLLMKCILVFVGVYFLYCDTYHLYHYRRHMHFKKKKVFFGRESRIKVSLFSDNISPHVLQEYMNVKNIKRDISIGLLQFFPVAYEKKLLPRRKQDIASDFCFNRYQLSPLTTRWPFCSAQMSLHMIQNKE